MSRPINTADNYRERLLKHIPSEVIGVYLSIHGLLVSADALPTVVNWILFVVFLGLTPLWLVFFQAVRSIVQNVLSGVAFVVWSMTFPGGPFTTIPGYELAWGSGLLILFSGVVAPLVGKAAAR